MQDRFNERRQGNRFIVSGCGVFGDKKDSQVELAPIAFNVGRINNLFWCVNTVGFVELFWESKDEDEEPIRFCVLSGNGRWDLSDALVHYHRPEWSTGRVLMSTQGFAPLDSFSLIVSGTKEE